MLNLLLRDRNHNVRPNYRGGSRCSIFNRIEDNPKNYNSTEIAKGAIVMARPELVVVIATCGSQRRDLLDRTLTSLMACDQPANLKEVVIAENGPDARGPEIVEGFRDLLPVRYQYTEPACKSHALNVFLESTSNEFVIFFDDDIRIHKRTLMAYNEAFRGRTSGVFFGGRVLCDYEGEAPEPWLLGFFPPSGKGWDLGDSPLLLDGPYALGCNWGAFATDLKRVGGFDTRFGPDRNAIATGQDTQMQVELMRCNVLGEYVPDAIVWHYVPRWHCTEDWLLERVAKMSAYDGIAYSNRGPLQRLHVVAKNMTKIVAYKALVALVGNRLPPARRFQYLKWATSCRGFLKGLRHGRSAV